MCVYMCYAVLLGFNQRHLLFSYFVVALISIIWIGDHALKNVGVVADPEITPYTIAESDKFMIMASDGVWEFISSQVSELFLKSL